MPQTEVLSALYQYRLEFFRVRGGERVARYAAGRADFDRAIEAAFFDGLRSGRFTEYAPPFSQARIEPVFASEMQGSPIAAGFRVVLPSPDGGEQRTEFPAEFFDRRACGSAKTWCGPSKCRTTALCFISFPRTWRAKRPRRGRDCASRWTRSRSKCRSVRDSWPDTDRARRGTVRSRTRCRC